MSVLELFPGTDVRVSLIWIEMLPTDGLEAARERASEIVDPRVRHYFDPRGTRLAGEALAGGIIRQGRGPAWDVYLLYDQEATWTDRPPEPTEWYHQLSGGQRADPSHFAGGVVGQRLHEAMHRMTRTACRHQESGR